MKSLIPWKKSEGGVALPAKSDPFSLLHREIDELFDQFSSGFFEGLPWRPSETGFSALRQPNIDFTETEKGYELSADLPGVEEKDLDVSIDEHMLTIKAEHSRSEEKKEKNYHIMERSSGSCQRSIELPRDVDPQNVKAKFKNGVLSISIPKNPELTANKRRIEIEA